MTLQTASIVDPYAVAELIGRVQSTRLLDVRTPGEFAAVHIPGAYNVPLDTLAEHAREIRCVGDAPVVLVCQSGNRARQADSALRSLGMSNLHLLDGGMIAWQAAGMTVHRGTARISLERQVRVTAGAIVAIAAVLAVTIHPLFALLAAFVGSGLVFAGLTDTCAMGSLLARLPYNQVNSCDIGAMVRALSAGAPPGLINAAPSAPACDAR